MNSKKPFLNVIDVISIQFQKSNVGLKSLLQQGLSEPEFYGDLVYKFRKIYACNAFSTQCRKTILQYIMIGYNENVIRQTACMAVRPITVNNFASLFGCKKGKRKVQGVPQSQTAALPRPQEEEETDKSKQAQTEQTYEKH